jgi:hypothetical protein
VIGLEYLHIAGTIEEPGCFIQANTSRLMLAGLRLQVEAGLVVARPLPPSAEPYTIAPPGSPFKLSVLALGDGTGEVTVSSATGRAEVLLGGVPWVSVGYEEGDGYRLRGVLRHIPTSHEELGELARYIPLDESGI